MTSQPSNEERNRLRLQAWERRNQGSSQAKGQNLKNAPLFGHPYKTNKGDELSNRIQRILGSFDDNTTTEPFIVPSSSTFPLTNSLHPTSDPSHKSPKGSCAHPSSRRDFNSPKYPNEDDSQASSQDSHSSLQNTAHYEKPFPPSPELHSPKAKDSQFHTPDEPQYHGFTENASSFSSGSNVQFSTEGISPPPPRTFSISHSQAFNPPLPYKQTNAPMIQKPTAYVRPMDGSEVITEAPELKPSLEHCTRPTDAILNEPIQEKSGTLPHFLETLTSDIQCVEHILSEMICSWPPLLSGIHSPRAAQTQSSVKVTENPPKPENGQLSTDPPQSHQDSSVDSELVSESGTDGPPVSMSPKSEVPVLMPPGDWQLDKLVHFRRQSYRSKSQWAAPPSPKQSSVGVFSPAQDTSNLLSTLSQKTVNLAAPQLPSTQENLGHQSCHKSPSTSSPSESPLPTDPAKQTKGGVSVHFDRTSSQAEERGFRERPQAKKEGRDHQLGKNVVLECEVTNKHNKNQDKKAFKYNQCMACVNSTSSSQSTSSDHVTPLCCCDKSKAEAKHKKVASLLQKDKSLLGCSPDSSKATLSLVVKINLNLLSEIQHRTKDGKPHQVTNSRKNDKGDQYCPKKKLKLHGNNPSLHTARLKNSNQSEASDKRSKKKDEPSLASSATIDCCQKSKKHKQYCGNAPQLNKEELACPSSPKKNSGKITGESIAKNPIKESSSNRPLLRFEDRHYPVKHYIKEAKRLKHKADAEMDKLRKIFHYLNGALFFIESGIAMERDPQISLSSYTMFSETVELIKFVLKLINSEEPSPTENDILALCLKCQALLHLAMFRHKEKAAISYSKTLTDHFNNTSQSPPDPSSFVNSGPAPCGSSAGVSGAPNSSVVVPQDIGQVTLTYVNITTLFLSAHDLWEQAEEFTNKGSGLSTELNKAVGVLSLTSTMSSMVCYIRQGLHWLQMDCLKVK